MRVTGPLLLLLTALLAGCTPTGGSASTDETGDHTQSPPNVLFFILDDAGIELFSHYDVGVQPVQTPTLDGFSKQALQFNNAWSYPVCSPTRASILTGERPVTHGIGVGIPVYGQQSLDTDYELLPERLRPAGYVSEVIGKWHLAPGREAFASHALDSGFDAHHGSQANLNHYRYWWRVDNGERQRETRYNTEVIINSAIRGIREHRGTPWLLWVAFNAPHAPYHIPPEGTFHTQPESWTPRAQYRAMVESVDTAIGIILSELTPAEQANTVVIVLGDNGTPNDVIGPDVPFEYRSKSSVYEPGVHVPLWIRGPGIQPGQTDHLVQVEDFHNTILELAGLPAAPVFGRSMVPIWTHDTPTRDIVMTEMFGDTQQGVVDPYHLKAARSERYKVLDIDGDRWLADLESHWYEIEGVNLWPEESWTASQATIAQPLTHQLETQ